MRDHEPPEPANGAAVAEGNLQQKPDVSAVPNSTDVQTRASRQPRGRGEFIAVTVKLDHDLYEKLKIFGFKRRRTNQDIIVSALKALLET